MHDTTFAAIARYAYSRKDLGAKEKAVLIAMGSFFNASTAEAYPSAQTLAAMTGFSEKTVRRAWSELEEYGVLKNHGQRKERTDTGETWGSNRFTFLVDLDTTTLGGQSDHRNPSFTYIEESSYRNNEKGISVDRQTTPFRPQPNSQSPFIIWVVTEFVPALSFQPADFLIDQGLKAVQYRKDAESELWLYWMEAFVTSSIGNVRDAVGVLGKDLIRSVYEEAIRSAPEHLDFGICSESYPAPKLLTTKVDQLVGEACGKVVPYTTEDPVEPPSLEELERRRAKREEYNAMVRERPVKVIPDISGPHPADRKFQSARASTSRQDSRTPKEEREDAEFVVDIEHMLDEQDE